MRRGSPFSSKRSFAAAFGGAGDLLVDRGIEIDDEAAPAEVIAVLGRMTAPPPVASTTLSRFDRSSIAGRLALAKTLLAFFLEDERDVDARAPLDLVVAVDELRGAGCARAAGRRPTCLRPWGLRERCYSVVS